MKHPENLGRVLVARDDHNADPRYAAAGYPRMVTHVAEIGTEARGLELLAFNVFGDEDPRERLRTIFAPAQYRDAVIRVHKA